MSAGESAMADTVFNTARTARTALLARLPEVADTGRMKT